MGIMGADIMAIEVLIAMGYFMSGSCNFSIYSSTIGAEFIQTA